MTTATQPPEAGQTCTGEELPPCIFCGRSLAFTFDVYNRPDGLIHGMPTCRQFEELDVLDFLAASRKEIERRTGHKL